MYWLGIEVTRKCNFRCRHCLRGDPQPIDLDLSKFEEKLISFKEKYIENLLISGGEPSQNCQGIKSVVKIIKKLGISVGHFCIASNGSNLNNSFVSSLYSLCNLVREINSSYICITKSIYHNEFISLKKIDNKIRRFRSKFKYPERVFTAFEFDEGDMVSEGRAVENLSIKMRTPLFDTTNVYVNVHGKALNYSELSYANQDNAEDINYCNRYMATEGIEK